MSDDEKGRLLSQKKVKKVSMKYARKFFKGSEKKYSESEVLETAMHYRRGMEWAREFYEGCDRELPSPSTPNRQVEGDK